LRSQGSVYNAVNILIHVFESNNGQQDRLLFPTSGQFWQETVQKGNIITTPLIRDVAGSAVIAFAHARVPVWLAAILSATFKPRMLKTWRSRCLAEIH
jgi:hypothetical protein